MNIQTNIKLAWPLALNALLVQSMVMVDVLMIAPLGELAVAALGIATTITAFLIGVQFALANGTQLILARAVGSGDQSYLVKHFNVGFGINFITAVFSSLVMLLCNLFLLRFLDLEALVLEMVQGYLSIMVAVMIVSAASQTIIVLFNSKSETQIPLRGLFLEIPVNIGISYVLIFGSGPFPELGVVGAAIGSLCAVAVRLLYLCVKLIQLKLGITLTGLWKFSISDVKEHLSDAAPIAANYMTLTLGTLVFQMLFTRLPVIEYAAIVLIMPWLRMGGAISTSWAQATSIHISQLIGKGDTQSTKLFVRQATKVTFIVASILVVLYSFFTFLVPFVYPTLQPETVAVIALLAPVYAALVFFRTINTTAGQALRAFGKSGFVLWTHASTQWLAAIPLCALLLFLGVPVFWVFSMMLLEEVLKTWPFFKRLKQTLAA